MWDRRCLPAAGTPLVVAVSGGRDSLVLWDVLAQEGAWPLVVWHLDHGLREDTIADADALHALARRHRAEGLAPALLRVERAQLAHHRGQEAAARAWRYRRLAAVAREVGAPVVVTAHHADDQAETVLLHLLRGAGLTGRAGMRPRRPLAAGVEVVRPLLGVRRHELAAYAERRGLAWHEDSTNRDLGLRRNFLLHRVLPTLEAGVPGITEALAALAARAGDDLTAEEAALAAWWQPVDQGLRLAPLLQAAPGTRSLAWRRLIRELGLPASRRTVEALEALAGGPVGKAWAGGGWRVQREREHLRWSRERRRPVSARPDPGT